MRHSPPVIPLSNSSKTPAFISSAKRIQSRITGRVIVFVVFCTLTLYLWIFWRELDIRIHLTKKLPTPSTTENGRQEGSLGYNVVVAGADTNATTAAKNVVDVIVVTEAPTSRTQEMGAPGSEPGGLVISDTPQIKELEASKDESYYKLGSTVPLEFQYELASFINTSFPSSTQLPLRESLDAYFHLTRDIEGPRTTQRPPPMVDYKHIWQTSKKPDRDWGNWAWHNAKWEMHMLNDTDAAMWVQDHFGGTHIETLWDDLPAGILRADVLRYLLIFMYGGVYSDTDTICLKSIEKWGTSAELWKDGDGWLPLSSKAHTSEDAKQALGPPSFIVGIEADFSHRADWQLSWSRPIQIAQWTFAGAPHHPILLDVISRIASATSRVREWSTDRDARVETLRREGRIGDAKALARIPLYDNGSNGGHFSVLEWTGPGAFTDAVFRYLEARYNFTWRELPKLEKPLRVGDVVILPITGFSPGVKGAKAIYDPMAMVQHKFYGSWKGVDS
ncbi:membrane-bound alpha-1,6- mannosyltransferase Initiation-specific [Tulasnella sp. 332]|nr:membrane-bound alpha-1,6- mannosyltransferase Initiation-specific [Tulasnella sp. 332]